MLDVLVDMRAHTVRVTEWLTFRNHTGRPLEELVMMVDPNRQAGTFTLINVSLPDDAATIEATKVATTSLYMPQKPTPGAIKMTASLEGPRMAVQLPRKLAPNCTIRLRIDFVLAPLPIPLGYYGRTGYLGFSERQFNLGHWFPMMSHYEKGSGWVDPQPFGVGESYVLPAADFDVTVKLHNAPPDVMIAGPGNMTRIDDQTWHFLVPGAREVTLSIGQGFSVIAAKAKTGQTIELYYFDERPPTPTPDLSRTPTPTVTPREGEKPVLSAPDFTLEKGVQALELYSRLFGPYPYNRLVLVIGDFADGMEFSGLVFISHDWFRSYYGNPESWLTLITVHEVAHQWWYLLVGNDQGHHPWLDEALASYTEALFMEEYYPDKVNWWWSFRVNAYELEGLPLLDAPIAAFSVPRNYINAIYLRGAMFWHDMRDAVDNDAAFFRWLRTYADAGRGEIVTPDDLWDAIPDSVNMAAVLEVCSRYLGPEARPQVE